MPTSDGKNCECAMTREGVGVPDSDPAKRSAEFTEKNFRRGKLFFRLLFFWVVLCVPNETACYR